MARHQISEYLTNNTIRTYYALDKSMMKAHAEKRNEDAESIARSLLENLDLPLLLRARACMMLGCGEGPDSLDMAKESVRVAELGLSLCEEPGELEKNLVKDCKKVLEEAQEAADQQDDDDDDEKNDDAMELV
ncbi:hypothetical protein M409DRAFT_18594 [Zasmidium cellare ATCC 36951]|uniref:Uncharacterized protein n=1 Tax=Zasmidium cellare ATCC 36951 TaxID=1080233 RepID=A0A6A6CZ88_ZASCE|nr:uncharacterized protein M409DRAFT_18594 [Zasmidium cellare ATCC 36951]KAF2171478.1 hypothetical protein M409DRAFT_18594 [Zasmidium cellare ATCC 36951]